VTNDAWIPTGQPVKRQQYVRTPLRRGAAFAHPGYTNFAFSDELDAETFAKLVGSEVEGEAARVREHRGRFVVQVKHTADTRW
jgi:hypothetical protein